MGQKRRAGTEEAVTGRDDAGFGLAEAITSIVILTTSILSLAAVAAQTGAAMNRVHLRTQALAAAQVQLESLLARSPAAVESGTATSEGIEMDWTVADAGSGVEIQMVYRYPTRGGPRTDTLIAALRGT